MKVFKRIVFIIFLISFGIFAFGKINKIREDKKPPVISSNQDQIHVSVKGNEQELKKGLTAKDDKDGDLTDEIIVGQMSPFIQKGVSEVEYLVFDKHNNVGRYKRTVYFDDYSSPVFSLTQPLMYQKGGEITISDRLYAYDVIEGNISSKLKFSSENLLQNEEGIYSLQIEVKNSFGDFAQAEIPINVIQSGNMPGKIELGQYLVYIKAGQKINAEEQISKVLGKDGEELDRSSVRTFSKVNSENPGSGQIRYELWQDGELTAVTYLTVIVTE